MKSFIVSVNIATHFWNVVVKAVWHQAGAWGWEGEHAGSWEGTLPYYYVLLPTYLYTGLILHYIVHTSSRYVYFTTIAVQFLLAAAAAFLIPSLDYTV